MKLLIQTFTLTELRFRKATPDADGWTKSLPKESWHPLKNGGFLMVKMRMEQSKQKLFKPPKIGGFDKMRMENVSCQKKNQSLVCRWGDGSYLA